MPFPRRNSKDNINHLQAGTIKLPNREYKKRPRANILPQNQALRTKTHTKHPNRRSLRTPPTTAMTQITWTTLQWLDEHIKPPTQTPISYTFRHCSDPNICDQPSRDLATETQAKRASNKRTKPEDQQPSCRPKARPRKTWRIGNSIGDQE